jgi:hypothetical protein
MIPTYQILKKISLCRLNSTIISYCRRLCDGYLWQVKVKEGEYGQSTVWKQNNETYWNCSMKEGDVREWWKQKLIKIYYKHICKCHNETP